jgi:dipeptidyl aminopeptidase/acylaminoacyl peptidase
MGTLGGDWAFIIRRSFQFTPGGQFEIGERAFDMLTLVPLDSAGPSTREVTVAVFASSIGRGVAPNNQLSAQFSPDGSRVVLSVALGPEGREHLGLVILDLASGTVTELLSDPAYHYDTPAWSPGGDWIIYGRRSVIDGSGSSLWISPPEPGGNQRGPLIAASPGVRAYVYGWIDAGRVLVSRSQRYEVIEPLGVGGMPCVSCPPPDESLRSVGGLTIQDRDSADLRRASPRFVGVFTEGQPLRVRASIEVADPPAGGTVVRVEEPDVSTDLFRPRWRPAADDILFTREGTGDTPVGLFVVTSRGTQTEVARNQVPLYADWTPSGDEIAWVEGPSIGSAIRVVKPDGTGVRVIHSDGGVPEGKIVTVDFGTVRF